MALSAFMAAIQQISAEKNIPEERILETVEAAIAAAYRRDYGTPGQNIRVKLNEEGEGFKVFQVFDIIEDEEMMDESDRQMLLPEARQYREDAELGEEIVQELPYHDDFGRIAAQTAKQVIVQRIREAEREILFDEFKEKEQKLQSGSVQNIEGDVVIVALGKSNAVMPPREQIRNEFYSVGQRIRVFVKEVSESLRGPQIIVSRSDARFIRELFALEVPEIEAGTVEVRAVSREAGSRTKMAVFSDNESIDPIGSCVGQGGKRVQAVLSEIGEEKIDIILWDDNVEQFIRNALSPAKVRSLKLDTERMHAAVEVDPDQLSLAIGKGGQNVRLASKLTGYTIDIVRDQPASAPIEAAEEVPAPSETPVSTEETAEAAPKAKKASKKKAADAVEAQEETVAETVEETPAE